MQSPLDKDLIARIRQRATDPETRTDAPPTTRGRSVNLGAMSVVSVDLGTILRGDANPSPSHQAPALKPADDGTISDAEHELGFALPPSLRQLYEEVANGGFGPGAGILPLQEVVRIYRALLTTPPGRRGQKWPSHLLPITRTDPGHQCIDLNSGELIFWDEEELANGASDKVWKRSFKREAPDLGHWFERWLQTPSPEQKMRESMQKAKLEAMRQTLAYWRGKTPEERAAFGLPETGWENVLFGHLGIDLSTL